LVRAARVVDDAEALASGDPRRMLRRGKTVMLGRALRRAYNHGA
jgi:hypothetical protein